jgi:hypothetical protein
LTSSHTPASPVQIALSSILLQDFAIPAQLAVGLVIITNHRLDKWDVLPARHSMCLIRISNCAGCNVTVTRNSTGRRTLAETVPLIHQLAGTLVIALPARKVA